MLRPLHLLLMKDCKWNCKTVKPLRLATHASPFGIGAVLSHITETGDEKPTAFASRTLSLSECNYEQIEKEALSVIRGIKAFHK